MSVGPGGGGGRVVIDPGAGVFTATGGTIDVSGGSGGSGAGGGDLGQVFVVPEPMSLVMVGTGGLVLLGYGWRRRRRATA
ncbi:MAG TPA: PEP-CTERM sorting domain-containing protein [Isosphaeraceae bacterium]|nr:PEP-CTERM sorting domain-containing protein [Isosphaeraceae bacterium]